MAPHELRRPYKRPSISDQQRRREVVLQRQSQHRADSQNRARNLASSIIDLNRLHDSAASGGPDAVEIELDLDRVRDLASSAETDASEIEMDPVLAADLEEEKVQSRGDMDLAKSASMRGGKFRRWFARQFMLPEWMIDVPPGLDTDWYVFARPSGKRCLVVSSDGTTVSRLRNGLVLHRFPSSLPYGARRNDTSGHSYCILDCIFHEPDQVYYVIDMVCWRGYSLYDCTTEFRFFWLNSKLEEAGACDGPSQYHRYRFSIVPVYNCDLEGLRAAYIGDVSYAKDGLQFYNKHAHYQTGNTPLVLVWKDGNCSQYVLDTDNQGQVPPQQQVVLELQGDGKLATSDDPPVVFGCLHGDFVEESGLYSGYLLRFAIKHESVRLVDGKMEIGDLQYIGKANRARPFADSYSKVFFQYIARNSPIRYDDLVESIQSNLIYSGGITDVDMAD